MDSADNQGFMPGSISKSFRVLLIDDDDGIAQLVKSEIEKEIPGVLFSRISDFDDAFEKIKNHEIQADAIILDLFDDPSSSTSGPDPGNKIWKQLWTHDFFPVIIYSAHESLLLPEMPATHPLVQRIQKGTGSMQILIQSLKSFPRVSEAISEIYLELTKAMHEIMTQVPITIWANQENTLEEKIGVLKRSALRRLAALVDRVSLLTPKKISSWEIYIVPHLEELMMGDIYQKLPSDNKNPLSYRVVLTPSCDLTRASNDKQVILAKCDLLSKFVKAAGFVLPIKEETKEKFAKKLNEPHCGGNILLPELPSYMPAMTLCLDNLEIVTIGELKDNTKYKRMASIDSPFREQIAWAFIQISGRPGMPDRNMEKWIDDLGKYHQATQVTGTQNDV